MHPRCRTGSEVPGPLWGSPNKAQVFHSACDALTSLSSPSPCHWLLHPAGSPEAEVPIPCPRRILTVMP